MVMSFIGAHWSELGIEPICRELAIAPFSYHEHAARQVLDPDRPSIWFMTQIKPAPENPGTLQLAQERR
jgi:hypothetical protein